MNTKTKLKMLSCIGLSLGLSTGCNTPNIDQVNEDDLTDVSYNTKSDLADSYRPDNMELIFHSGFQPGTQMVDPIPSHKADLEGIDYSLQEKNDWDAFDDHPNIGYFNFQLKDGNVNDRKVELISDPTAYNIIGKRNTVLHYWLKNARENNNRKGRVEANIAHAKGLNNFYASQRLFLHKDFDILKSYEHKITWLTIQEFWNNPNWDDSEYPFRVTLSINKKSSGTVDELYFNIKAQTYNPLEKVFDTIWTDTNASIPVPVEKWFKLSTHFIEGNENTGRVVVKIMDEKQYEQTLFDVTNWTTHPENPEVYDGVPHFSSMKLYTKDSIIDHVRNNGGVLQMYWDDFELWKKKEKDSFNGR